MRAIYAIERDYTNLLVIENNYCLNRKFPIHLTESGEMVFSLKQPYVLNHIMDASEGKDYDAMIFEAWTMLYQKGELKVTPANLKRGYNADCVNCGSGAHVNNTIIYDMNVYDAEGMKSFADARARQRENPLCYACYGVQYKS